MKHFLTIIFLLTFALQLGIGQSEDKKTRIDGEIVTFMIENGDTILTADLDSITVTSRAIFKDEDEFRRYRRYRRYGTKVYPYAVESIKIFKKYKKETEGLKKRKKRKYVKSIHKELKKQFNDPLKNLSRTQGKILIKMIEKELDTPMYFLLKDIKNGFVATKWQSIGKLYGYNLKDGYIPGEDEILDAVLNDFNISYDLE